MQSLVKYAALIFLLVSIRHTFAENLPANDAASLRAVIANEERNLLNIKITAKYSSQVLKDANNKLTDDGDGHVTTFFTGLPGSQFRVEFDERRPWAHGLAPFVHEIGITAYNGRVQQELLTRMGTDEHPDHGPPRGEIVGKRTLGMNGFYSGWTHTIYGACDGDLKPKRLSEYLSWALKDANSQVKVEESRTKDNLKSLKLTISTKIPHAELQDVFFLDPDRHYALLGRYKSLNDTVIEEFEVSDLHRVSTAVYYPWRGTRTVYTNDKKMLAKLTFEIEDVVANAEQFSLDAFTIKWPTGAVVQDTLNSTKFSIAPGNNELVQNLNNQVETVRAQAATAPAEEHGGPTTPSQQEATTPLPQRLSQDNSLYFWGIGLCIVLVGVILLVQAKRKTKMPLPVALVLFILPLASAVRGASPITASELPLGQQLESCGLNTTAFTLMYFKRSFELNDVASKLELGDRREMPATLLNIDRLLASYGLHVEAFSDATMADVITKVESDSLIVLHTRIGEPGHFLILGKRSGLGVQLINPGVDAFWMETRQLLRFETVFSGNFLVVRDSTKAAASGASFVLDKSRIELEAGSIVAGQGEWICSMDVVNPTSVPLRLLSQKGSCDCFKAASFRGNSPLELARESRATLELKFDKNRLGEGEQFKSILFEIQDVSTRFVAVIIHVDVKRGYSPAWTPEVLDLGLITSRELLSKVQPITVDLPPNVSIKTVDVENVSLVIRSLGPDMLISKGENGYVRYRFVAQLNASVTGRISNSIHFVLAGSELSEIRIPVQGEVRERGSQ